MGKNRSLNSTECTPGSASNNPEDSRTERNQRYQEDT